MKDLPFSYKWQFSSKSKPTEIWPLLSDVNLLFKKIGKMPVKPASVSHNLPKGHREYTFEQMHRLDIWEEEPYQWEAPFHLKVRRTYKNGLYKNLLFSISISENRSGSTVVFSFSGEARGFISKYRIKRIYSSRLKRKLKKVLQEFDQKLLSESHSIQKTKWPAFSRPGKWEKLTEELTELSSEPELSQLLIQTMKESDPSELQNIRPHELADNWNMPLNCVLDILFFAAKLDILNFDWELACPGCRISQHRIHKLSEATEPLYCSRCQKEFELDFHNTVLLTFEPNPLVRMLPDKTYSFGNPSKQPHVKLMQYVYPGQKRFVKINLDPGIYKIYSDSIKSAVYATVTPEGMEHATLSFNRTFTGDQHVELSTEPNFVLHNQTDERIFIIAEDTDWKKYTVSASEVTSLQLFRNLFPRELIRNNEKMKAGSVTVLFTDLFNSSSLYNSVGDETAIGQVINHFEILRIIVREERGAIVKTIGDAVMAVFQKPVHAVRAFSKAQEFFKNSTDSDSPIYLKGGMHIGDCTALTLNNRIDFFGNTVNIAARLVEKAGREELVISNEAYKCHDLSLFLNEHRDHINVHHFDLSLKGFDDMEFEAKRLSLSKSVLRLVV